MEPLVAALLPELMPYLDKPFLFFGPAWEQRSASRLPVDWFFQEAGFQNELSAFSVLDGLMAGENETTLIAGCTDDEDFNKAVSESLDFWDQVTPDSSEVGGIHKLINEKNL